MFRIRKIYDDVSRANREAIAQVVEIMRGQFPLATEADIQKLPRQLQDPLKYRYRTILFVAEDSLAQVRGFAVLLHLADVNICYLEYMSAAPGKTGGGIGGVLYERLREEALTMGALGLFFESSVDDSRDPEVLQQVTRFRPQTVVLCFGLDTAKADPTGTWALGAEDFLRNGQMIGALNIPTLVVQEGGYRTRTLGVNARHFFDGLWGAWNGQGNAALERHGKSRRSDGAEVLR